MPRASCAISKARCRTSPRDATRNARCWSSEERYRTLVEHAQIGVYVMRDGRYIYVNQRFAALTGYDERELIGMHWTELASDAGRRIVEERLAARERGEPLPVEYETLLRARTAAKSASASAPDQYGSTTATISAARPAT